MKSTILFFLAIACNSIAISQVTNDSPCTAIALSIDTNCIYTTGTNVGATDSGISGPGCANYNGGDVWYSVIVPSGGEINISMEEVSGGISDGGMAVYSGSTCSSLTLIECDDDSGPGLLPEITLSGQTPGETIWIRVWEYGNDTYGEFNICTTIPPAPPANIVCATPEPICSGSAITFTAQSSGTSASVTNPGNDYDCLYTTPNPTWFYLEIATPGDIAIDITAGSDIDFALWGPFSDLATAISNCNSYGTPIDCSYSTAATEQANVTGVLAGEVYILLVTNYAAVVQSISLTESTAMTSSTNCDILGVELSSFDGYRINEGNLITWTTATEENNSHFIIERSDDNSVWTFVDLVKGSGNSTKMIDYSIIDRNIEPKEYFYRIKQFDFDGKTTTSHVIHVENEISAYAKLIPNPTSSNVIVSTSNFIKQIDLLNVNGMLLNSSQYKKLRNVQLNVEGYKSGMYFLNIHTENGEILTKRLVIQN